LISILPPNDVANDDEDDEDGAEMIDWGFTEILNLELCSSIP